MEQNQITQLQRDWLEACEQVDIPEDKLKTAKHLLMPLKDYLLREDF